MFPVYCVKDVSGLYRGNHSPLEGESQKPSRQAKADAVGGAAVEAASSSFVALRGFLFFADAYSWDSRLLPEAGAAGWGVSEAATSSSGGRLDHQEASMAPDIFIQGPKTAEGKAAIGLCHTLTANPEAMPPF